MTMYLRYSQAVRSPLVANICDDVIARTSSTRHTHRRSYLLPTCSAASSVPNLSVEEYIHPSTTAPSSRLHPAQGCTTRLSNTRSASKITLELCSFLVLLQHKTTKDSYHLQFALKIFRRRQTHQTSTSQTTPELRS